MISNYGMLWQRKYVHLGAGSNKGTLLGYRSGIDQVDFREQIGIYVLLDKDLLPIYVGQAGNGNARLFARLKQHTDDHLWNRWEYFSWFGLRAVNANCSLSKYDSAEKTYKASGGEVLDELEGILIAAMEPKLNKQGAKFGDALQFYQAVDDNIVDLTLEDVSDQIDELGATLKKLQKSLSKK